MLPSFHSQDGKKTQAMPHSADSAISLYLFLQSFPLCSWEKDIMLHIKLSESTETQPLFLPSFCFHCTLSNAFAGKDLEATVADVGLLNTDNQH